MLALNMRMSYFGFGRAYALLNKTMDMVMNTRTFGKRRGIWKTSWAIFMEHPVKGVGMTHYSGITSRSRGLLSRKTLRWNGSLHTDS